MTIGRMLWAIPDGYLPSSSTSSDHALVSHEAACILNASDQPANIALTLFFADREPVGPYHLKVPARRTLHLRFDDLDDPQPLPIPPMRRCSNPTSPSSCSVPGSTPAAPRCRCCRRSPMPRREQPCPPARGEPLGTFRSAKR